MPTTAPEAPAQADTRARLHQLIDQIADEAVLRAALLLLQPQVSQPEAIGLPETEPAEVISSAWQAQLDSGIRQLDAGQGVPFEEAMARLAALKAA